jgi:integrase
MPDIAPCHCRCSPYACSNAAGESTAAGATPPTCHESFAKPEVAASSPGSPVTCSANCAILLDEGELSARQIADQLGHAKVSMTQDNYLGRRLTNRRTAETLDRALGPTLG